MKPALRAIDGGKRDDRWAGASDREMIEATAAAVGLFSAKWKVEILFLLAAGVRRHSRLLDHLLISKKVLGDALKSLERDGLVRRSVLAETPVRVEYSLTPLGRSLTPRTSSTRLRAFPQPSRCAGSSPRNEGCGRAVRLADGAGRDRVDPRRCLSVSTRRIVSMRAAWLSRRRVELGRGSLGRQPTARVDGRGARVATSG
jgi:DNA-binding HxlR family transcriptional regulator